MVLAGMPATEFLLDNIKTFNDFKPLNEEEYKVIDQVIEIINENTSLPARAAGTVKSRAVRRTYRFPTT
jgi:predicted aldo/keto reductase-like oxidoreductase